MWKRNWWINGRQDIPLAGGVWVGWVFLGDPFLLAPLECGGCGFVGSRCPRLCPIFYWLVMISISDLWLSCLGIGVKYVVLLTSYGILLSSGIVAILLLNGCHRHFRVPVGRVCWFCHFLSFSFRFPVVGLLEGRGALCCNDPIAQLFLWVWPIGWSILLILGYGGFLFVCGHSL